MSSNSEEIKNKKEDELSRYNHLLESIKSANPKEVQHILTQGCPVNVPTHNEESTDDHAPQPLAVALARIQEHLNPRRVNPQSSVIEALHEIISLLLEHGATLQPGESYLPALLIAAQQGRIDVLERVHADGHLDRKTANKLLKNLLMLASASTVRMNKAIRHVQMTRSEQATALWLIDRGADSNPPTRGGSHKSQFEMASIAGMQLICNRMVMPMTPETRDMKLRLLILRSNTNVNHVIGVKALIESGADVTQLWEGRSLIEIAEKSHEDVQRLLRSELLSRKINEAMSGYDGPEDSEPRPSSDTI